MGRNAPADQVGEAEPDEGLDAADERPDLGGESFENAAPVDRATVIEMPDDPGGASAEREPPPALERVIEKISPHTRALLAELFKAEVTAVRKISRDKLW